MPADSDRDSRVRSRVGKVSSKDKILSVDKSNVNNKNCTMCSVLGPVVWRELDKLMSRPRFTASF